MDELIKAKLQTNIANLPKMLSGHFIFWAGIIWTTYISLPATCAADAANCLSQAGVLEALRPLYSWIPAPLLTLGITAFGLYLRVKPQKNLTPEVAAAKSADAPGSPDAP